MVIGETLCRVLAKIVVREAWNQEKTACVNLQLCVDLAAGIESATHAVRQRRIESSRERRREEEARKTEEEESLDLEAGEERLPVVTMERRRRLQNA